MNYDDKSKTELVSAIAALEHQLASLKAQLTEAQARNKHLEAELVSSQNEAGLVQAFPQEDITERKNAENALRLSDEILNQMPDAIAVTDLDGTIQRWMGMATALFGYTAEEIIGQSISILNHPDVNIEVINSIQKALNEKDFFLGEVRGVHKNGTEIPIEVRAKTVYNAAGQPQNYISINRDITERKQAETALQEAEIKYRILVETLPAITYILEPSDTGRMQATYISPQVESILGFSQAEWLGSPDLWKEQIHPDDRDEVLAIIRQSYANNENINLEYRSLTRDGRTIWFHNRNNNLKSEDSRRFVHGVMFDITQQKQLELQLRQAQRMEAVGQMAGGIAHNFNNVLTALIGHTELALDTISADHPARPDLESIRKSGLRAADLIHQLLTFTRRQNPQPLIININDLISDFSPMFRQLIGAGIELVIALEPDLARTKIDAAQFEQVLINLIVNARDAMSNGGKLAITTRNVTVVSNQHSQLSAGNYTLLSVTDTGAGMTREVMAHIFEPFYTTKESNQQTGLGLSTCFGIIKQNDGHILVESSPGNGTTFEVYLPCHNEDKSKITHHSHRMVSLPTGTESILLVDDARLVREMSARVLRQQGYTVLEAEDGNEALNIIEEQQDLVLDLLITDMVMPQMGGDILAQHVQYHFPELKVLFISGYSHHKTASLGKHTLHSAILTKPFSPDILSIEVRNLLDSEPDEAVA